MRLNRFAAKTSAGFTLVEVCVAMAIGLLVLGVATLGISGVRAEHELQRTAAQVETLVRQTLRDALVTQRPLWLGLYGDGLSSLSDVADKEEVFLDGKLLVCRAGEKSYRAPEKDEAWLFSAGGLCEPMSLRIECEKGNIEIDFDPLTACARRKSVIVTAQ